MFSSCFSFSYSFPIWHILGVKMSSIICTVMQCSVTVSQTMAHINIRSMSLWNIIHKPVTCTNKEATHIWWQHCTWSGASAIAVHKHQLVWQFPICIGISGHAAAQTWLAQVWHIQHRLTIVCNPLCHTHTRARLHCAHTTLHLGHVFGYCWAAHTLQHLSHNAYPTHEEQQKNNLIGALRKGWQLMAG